MFLHSLKILSLYIFCHSLVSLIYSFWPVSSTLSLGQLERDSGWLALALVTVALSSTMTFKL